MKLTLLLPAYNEAENLPATLPCVYEFLQARFGGEAELLIVDDGSTDRTPEILEEFQKEHPRVSPNGEGEPKSPTVTLLRTPENRGKGHAVRTGMLAAAGERVIFTDCDLAYGIDAVGKLYDFFDIHPEADAVLASRALHPDGYRGYTPLRRLASRTYRALLRMFFGLRQSDSQSGLKGFTRPAAHAVFSLCACNRYAFDFEAIMIANRLGVRLAEMPARVAKNCPGHVRLLRDSARMLGDLRHIRRRVRGLDAPPYQRPAAAPPENE